MSTAVNGTMTTFVLQEHRARSRHFDFRIAKDGVLKSWAVPKGPPLASGERHLAIQVEDHPLDYARFEGEIPAGTYGAGTVRLWDQGACELREWGGRRIVFVLHGRHLRGCFGLIRLPGTDRSHWLFLRLQRRAAPRTGHPRRPAHSLRAAGPVSLSPAGPARPGGAA